MSGIIRITFLFLFAVAFSGLPVLAADKTGEYGKAEIEIDRSVLEDLKGYVPPPMFGGPPVSVETSKPSPALPSAPLTSPSSLPDQLAPPPSAEQLLSHPVENNHVLTLQRPAPVLDPPSIASHDDAIPVHEINSAAVPPVPPRKSTLRPANPVQLIQSVSTSIPSPKIAVSGGAAYKPKTPQTMPAVPMAHVEATSLPQPANLPPPIVPDAAPRPSIGERMMDNTLTHNMVQDTGDVKKALGIGEHAANERPDQFSLACKSGDSDLSKDQKIQIDQNVITELSSNASSKIMVRSYAARTDGLESSARRISLSRALAVRSYLLEKGISPTRIDVRALGENTADQPVDRIDISFIAP